MATNELSQECLEYLLQRYSDLHDVNTELNPQLEKHLGEEYGSYLALENNLMYSVICHPFFTEIKNIDLIISVLANLYISVTEEVLQKSEKSVCIILPVFDPVAMLEKKQWFYPQSYRHSNVLVDTEVGICNNLGRLGMAMGRALNIFEDAATFWSEYSGYKLYPVPALRADKNAKKTKRAKNAKKAYADTAESNYYTGEYGELRLELLRFVINQLVIYRIKNA